MKTIGFIDYYISEWHANNYPAWIQKVSQDIGEDFCVKYVWAEKYVSLADGRNTDEWCNEFGIEKCDTISELCEKSDYILVLSPSNPEKHLQYAKEVLKYNKNTYIDKTFAPDYATAKEIFDIAERNGTKFFSTSALRYASELKELNDVNNIIITGNGGNFEEYIIHQIEMMVSLINSRAKAVKVRNQGRQYVCDIDFEENKKATLIFAPSMPFTVCADEGMDKSTYKEIKSDFFENLMERILNFYKDGELPFDSKQTLRIMKIREGLIKGLKQLETWIEL